MSMKQIGPAAYVTLLFSIVVTIYGIVFTRNLMDVARKKYVIEEGVFAALEFGKQILQISFY
jgi:hypothetical protein